MRVRIGPGAGLAGRNGRPSDCRCGGLRADCSRASRDQPRGKMSSEPRTDPDSMACKRQLMFWRPRRFGRSGPDVGVWIIVTLLAGAYLAWRGMLSALIPAG